MRAIKFRAWDKKCNRFIKGGEVIYRISEEEIEVCINEQGFDNGEDRQKDFIIMQYTGLNDKNGKEIYEGDILLNRDWVPRGGAMVNTTVVSWSTKNAGFLPFAFDMYDYPNAFREIEELEVIGNIYENPELLQP